MEPTFSPGIIQHSLCRQKRFQREGESPPVMGMRLHLSKLFVTITMDTALSGTSSTSFLKSAIRGNKGQPGDPSAIPEESLGYLGNSSKALYYHSPTSALLRCNACRKAIRKSWVCIEEEGCSQKTGLLTPIVSWAGNCINNRALCHWQSVREGAYTTLTPVTWPAYV